MTPSQQAKASGLKSLKQVTDLTDISKCTLTNWHRDRPKLFSIALEGCKARLANQPNDGISQITIDCYLPAHVSVGDIFETHLAQLPDQGVYDSYYTQKAPLYIKEFSDGIKVKITIEELEPT